MTTSTPPGVADRAWTEEIVYVETEDGLHLAGVAIRPAATTARRASGPASGPAIVWIHGNASNFYAPAYVAIGRALASRGHPVISANTRGHDISAIISGTAGPMAGAGGGAGWERFEETPRDLAAWVERAARLVDDSAVGAGVIVAGHSSGAQRVALYAADRPDPRVRGLVLASPDLRGFFPPGEIAAARALIAAGHDLEVLPAQPYVPWYRQCARTVVSRADVTARRFADDALEPALAAIAVPILAFYGTREHNAATQLEAIRARASAAPRVDTPLIPDADHFYTGHEPEIAATVATWAAALTPA